MEVEEARSSLAVGCAFMKSSSLKIKLTVDGGSTCARDQATTR
jgi:hypothetical protein